MTTLQPNVEEPPDRSSAAPVWCTQGVGPARPDPAEVAALHVAYRERRDATARDRLVEHYQGLARGLAARAVRRNEELDDLVQVAMYGLLQALERFDPARGNQFATFAWATIQGELKHHHRSSGWSMRVPRRLQDAYLRVAAAVDELRQDLQREPTPADVAARTGDPEDVVIEALDVRMAQRLSSIDASWGSSTSAYEVGEDDDRLAQVEDGFTLRALIARLPAREREIVRLRFEENLTQSQIAARVGLSQMHVSRLLAASVERLRVWANAVLE